MKKKRTARGLSPRSRVFWDTLVLAAILAVTWVAVVRIPLASAPGDGAAERGIASLPKQ